MTPGSPGPNDISVCCENGPHCLVQYVVVNGMVLITIFKGGAGNILLLFANTFHIEV